HTVTLTLSVFNIVRLPSQIVEPMIAGSIVFVALTNVFWPAQSRGKLRLATAFFFGLFHGLGFAGGLLDAMEGLPGMSIGLAIIAFSLGVELGHQLIVLPVFGVMKLARTRPEPVPLRALRYGSAAISLAGMFYLAAALR
ncbi:MAG: HupE/UreJ family protein, partial [Verrucomicrobiota bacterium]